MLFSVFSPTIFPSERNISAINLGSPIAKNNPSSRRRRRAAAAASSTDRARYRAASVPRLYLKPLGSRDAGEAEVREGVVSFLLLRPFGPENTVDMDKEGHRLLELGGPRLRVVRPAHFAKSRQRGRRHDIKMVVIRAWGVYRHVRRGAKDP